MFQRGEHSGNIFFLLAIIFLCSGTSALCSLPGCDKFESKKKKKKLNVYPGCISLIKRAETIQMVI